MRVIFIGTDKSIISQNGDARRRQLRYARLVSELTIIVLCLTKDGLKQTKIENLTSIPTNSASRWLYVFDALKIISRLGKIDIISAQGPFIEGLIGVLAKFIWGTKLNIQLHIDMFTTNYFRRESGQNFIFYCLSKVTLFFADSIRAGSQRLAINPKAFEAPVPMDINFFWHRPRTKTFGQIVSVGRLVAQKNYPLLLEVARKLPELRFIIVGDGPGKPGNAPKNVTFVGHKSPSEYKKIFLQSDLFLSTSNYEGWGMALTEALACGIPVAMTNTGCAGELVINGKIGGFVCNIGDRKGLTAAVEKLFSDPTLRQKLVLAVQKILKKNYQAEKLAKGFIIGLRNTK